MEQVISFEFSQGHVVKYRLISDEKYSRSAMIIHPAMGIRASYYKRLARCVSEELEVDAIISDYRGMGTSGIRADRKHKIGYAAMVEDMSELINHLVESRKYSQFLLCGHSLGGQIASMYAAKHSSLISEIILIGSCLPHYKGWQGRRKKWLKFAGATFYPLSGLLGYFPGETFGFAGREGIHTMKDWCHLVNHGTFSPIGDPYDFETGIKKFQGKITAFSFSNDELAPQEAVENLLCKFDSSSHKIHHHLKGYDHFNWSKSPHNIIKLLS